MHTGLMINIRISVPMHMYINVCLSVYMQAGIDLMSRGHMLADVVAIIGELITPLLPLYYPSFP